MIFAPMKTEQYGVIQKVIEEFEDNNTTGKIILFFEDGEIKSMEIDRKLRLTIALLDKE